MAHHINLVVQNLHTFLLVKCTFGDFVVKLACVFTHSPKRHLKFTKLAKFMETRGNKIL